VFVRKVQRIVKETVFAFRSTAEEAVEQLQSQLLAVIASGEKFVRVDVDPLALDHADLRALIRTLRRVRGAGGELVLRVTRPDLHHTLRALALDKVFAIESSGVSSRAA